MRDQLHLMEELIWERQDGEISAADRARLEAHLARDPAARATAEAAEKLTKRIEAVGREVVVPLELRPRIDTALTGAWREPEGRRPGGLLQGLRSLFAPSPALRPAYLAVGLLGLFLGAVGFYVFQSVGRLGAIPEQELYGTMRQRAGGGVDLVLPASAGTLTLRRDGAVLEIEADLVSGPLSPDELRIHAVALSIRSLEPQAGGSPRLEAGADAIALSHLGAGHHRLSVEIADAGAPVELLVFGQGRPILRREIRLADL